MQKQGRTGGCRYSSCNTASGYRQLRSRHCDRGDYAEAHYNLGVVYKELSRLDEALESGDRALALQPEYSEAL